MTLNQSTFSYTAIELSPLCSWMTRKTYSTKVEVKEAFMTDKFNMPKFAKILQEDFGMLQSEANDLVLLWSL